MTRASTPSHRHILLASLTGTAVEFYDFYIYATAAALVFGPLFFPASSATAQLLLSYASFGLAFVARPVGAIAFGHFGDRVGRKSTLVVSLMLMGGSTVAIAFLPTYAQAGWIAPLLLLGLGALLARMQRDLEKRHDCSDVNAALLMALQRTPIAQVGTFLRRLAA